MIASAPPTVLLPGSDPVKAMTQPQIVSDPIVNQTLEKGSSKPETSTQTNPPPPAQPRSNNKEQGAYYKTAKRKKANDR